MCVLQPITGEPYERVTWSQWEDSYSDKHSFNKSDLTAQKSHQTTANKKSSLNPDDRRRTWHQRQGWGPGADTSPVAAGTAMTVDRHDRFIVEIY